MRQRGRRPLEMRRRSSRLQERGKEVCLNTIAFIFSFYTTIILYLLIVIVDYYYILGYGEALERTFSYDSNLSEERTAN